MTTEFLTIEEAATLTRKSVSTIRSWVRGYYVRNGVAKPCNVGFPPAIKSGNRWIFRAKEIDAWLKSREKSSTPPMPA